MISIVLNSLKLLDKRDRRIVYFFLILTLIVNSFDIVALGLVGVIASVALGENSSLPEFIPQGWDRTFAITVLLGAASAVFVAKTVGGLFLARRRQLFLARLEGEFSQKISEFLFSADLARVRRYSRPHLEWMILRSTNVAFQRVLTHSFQLFAEATLALSIVVLFVVVDWQAALAVTLYFSTILLLFQGFSSKQSAMHGSGFTVSSIDVGQRIGDMLAAFREISVSAARDFFVSRIGDARRGAALYEARQLYLQAIPRLIVELSLILGALGFVLIEVATSSGQPDFAVLGIFLFGSLRMMSALLPLQRGYTSLLFDEAQARDAQEVVRDSLESTHRLRGEPLWSPTVAVGKRLDRGLSVSFTNVEFSFRDGKRPTPVLDGLTLSIPENSSAAIIGPSGAGKSTIVDLMLGLHQPDGGDIEISGCRPRELQSLRRGIIGYVPQKPGIVSGTVQDNIALGYDKKDVDDRKLWAAIGHAELRDLVESLPEGPETPLGQHLDSLSGGQLQRIGLARALYHEPRLLVLDEATSALDAETESAISKSLLGFQGKMTIVIVAHRLSTIRSADRVFVIDRGSLIGQGKLEELSESVPLVKRYLDLLESPVSEKTNFQD